MALKVTVNFSIPYCTSFGEHMQIHFLDETGRVAAGTTVLRMDWCDGHVWRATATFTFDRAARRAQTAPFLYCFELARQAADGSNEVLRADCPQMTQHHSLDVPALLAREGKTSTPESVVVDVHELWDFPDQQTVHVLPK